MTESIALAIAVPAALGAAWLASRRSWSPAAADNRGIALQTVIVIVVMLVIAGGVAAVLLSRGSEVTADLAAQDVGVGVGTEAECQALATRTDTASVNWATGTCTLTGADNDPTGPNEEEITETECNILGGTFTAATGSAAETCAI